MHTPGNPLVSVIVPSFNHARFLPDMLDSTFAQDYRPLEVIVVDGASSDETTEILRGYSARHAELVWLSEKDKGPADAVNKGLAMARGRFSAIQNADDLYRPGALSAAVGALLNNPEAILVYGDVDFIDVNGRQIGARRFPDFSWEAFFANSCTFAQGSVVFQRQAAVDVGGWNGAYYACDLDFWLRLAFRGTPVHLPRVLSAWRRYPEQRTRHDQFETIWIDYARMIRDSADVRRASPKLRRLARASTHLFALRFYPRDRPWRIRAHMLCGLALLPTAWRYQPWQRFARFVPGQGWLRSLRQRFRRGESRSAL